MKRTVDVSVMEFVRGKKRVRLTGVEFKLLNIIALSQLLYGQGKVHSMDRISKRIGLDAHRAKTHLSNLRKKLREVGDGDLLPYFADGSVCASKTIEIKNKF